MNEKAKIFICTHTDFDCPVHDPVYEILDSRKLFTVDKAENGLDALFYSELLSYQYLAKHPDMLPDIVGFCGYRKYFGFMDDVPDIEALIDKHDCITTVPKQVRSTVYEQYKRCLCFADLDILKTIIYFQFNWLFPTFCKSLEGGLLYRANMFIVKKEDFIEMMDVVWKCLDSYVGVIGNDIRARIIENRDVYLDKGTGSRSVEHQYRIGGNLGERIINALIMYKYPEAVTYPINFVEKARPHRKLNV